VTPDHRREALPTFRIATVGHAALTGAKNASDIERAVTFIPDQFVEESDYAEIDEHADPTELAASRRLFLSLYQRMCEAPKEKGDTLFFIHGFDYDWPAALTHLRKLHDRYVEPEESPVDQIVYFTWPSHGSQRRYKKDQEIAQPSGMLLGRFFAKTLKFYEAFFGRPDHPEFCDKRIHLCAHSMGNQVLQEFMRAIYEYEFLRRPILGETLLLHADADWTALEPDKPMYCLHEYAERIHVYNNMSDDALGISERTKNREKRLGRHGPRDLRKIPPRTIVVDTTDLPARNADELDDEFFTAARRILGADWVPTRERVIDHWGYLHRPEVVADIYRVLRGKSSSEFKNREHKGGPLYKLRP
jgi:esterase/lipase superfamily enzyme